MKIGLISSAVPLINGGGRFIAEWLESELRRRGHQVETILIPNTENPETVLQQMIAFRAINLSDAYERVITFRPPAHVVQHPNKVVWFIHHFRQFYDLWDTPYCNIPNTAFGRSLRAQIFAADNVALNAARHVFTNSRIVKDRLSHFNSISSEVLYPPVLAPQRFRSGAYGGEIVSVCRLEPHKRQHMLVEALAHTRTPVRLRLCGAGSSPAYTDELNETARRLGVADRISIENRWITEDEKIDLLETALASAYVPFDEDSYGYPTLEAAHASRCTISVTDSGGVPEFVTDGVNGMITS
ncbi:glycosyltransferase family 4 protein, partial [Acidiphilium angustum]|uniref:glycosyltransferase family 4 protein n=1 Tax=Acidiphilium angustum TaxID=523 RepID=UPI0004940360